MRKQNKVRPTTDEIFVRANARWEQGKLRSAHRLLLLGAKRGDASAQHNLAYFYDVGIGLRPNRAKALHWYKLAYRRGLRVAASNIASIFRDEKDITNALVWYRRAALLHDGDANLEIAKLLLSQSEKNSSAIKYLTRTIKAQRRDVTPAAQQEARRLLSRIVRKRSNNRETPRSRTRKRNLAR